MVHVGTAISIINKEEAKKTFDILMQLDELHELEDDNNPRLKIEIPIK